MSEKTKYCVYDEKVGEALSEMASDTYDSIKAVQKKYPDAGWFAMLSTLAHRAATVATNAALGHPLDRTETDSPEAEVLPTQGDIVATILEMNGYHCAGPEGDYNAGMEFGGDYLDRDEVVAAIRRLYSSSSNDASDKT